MRKLRNFKCAETGSEFERFAHDDELVLACKCGGIASRSLSAPKVFPNTTGRSPSFSRRK